MGVAMKKSGRKWLIAANWKMNKTANEAADFIRQFRSQIRPEWESSVLICPPFTALDRASTLLERSTIHLGAQNMSAEKSGAFTGEIAADMLREFYVSHVILGHSERRNLFFESDDTIARKIRTALDNRLTPILCIGETLQDRDSGRAESVLERQIHASLEGIGTHDMAKVIIAYEPIWAIGTGQTASASDAQKTHAAIRRTIASRHGAAVADKILILYGGSLNPNNAKDLLVQEDIDGGLVGGAALNANSFAELVSLAAAINR